METFGGSVLFLITMLFIVGLSILAVTTVVLFICKLGGGCEAPAAASLPTNALTQNVRFRNLVVYSGYNTLMTEIDEVIVSPYGIFCIEYKAWRGVIFGSKSGRYWTQCKYNERIRRYSPVDQNYKHVKALEALLGDQLQTNIHSLVVFTNAVEVKTDYKTVLKSVSELDTLLAKHTKQVYSADQWHDICSVLAHASEHSREKMPEHIRELQKYLMMV